MPVPIQRHRSPAYPSMDLGDAVEVIRVVYRHERRHAVPVAVVAQHGGYSDMKSSSALRLIAALKQYGLVSEQGSGEDRKVRVSDLALDIVLDSDSDEKRRAALKSAALLPEVHKVIWAHFNGGLPSDATLKSYLIRDLNFNDTVVDLFIKKFRSTVAYAGLTADDKISDAEGKDEGLESGQAMPPATLDPPSVKTSPVRPALAPAPAEWPGPIVKLDLPGGNLVEIRLRKKVTSKEFESLKKIFELSELSFVDDSDSSAQ